MQKISKLQIFVLEDNCENVLAIIIDFGDSVVVKWLGEISSIVIHSSLDNFKKISLNNGRKLVSVK